MVANRHKARVHEAHRVVHPRRHLSHRRGRVGGRRRRRGVGRRRGPRGTAAKCLPARGHESLVHWVRHWDGHGGGVGGVGRGGGGARVRVVGVGVGAGRAGRRLARRLADLGLLIPRGEEAAVAPAAVHRRGRHRALCHNIEEARAALALVDVALADVVLLRMAGHLRRSPRLYEVPGDPAPVALSKLLQPEEEQAVLFLRPRHTLLPLARVASLPLPRCERV
mmetsp:Transcript_13083/g.41365  ORF Transcript_13083/g.41365 Transcript_13083/m.41365 type:complete len:223 (-) Transcript_13083:330-998(-)